VLSSTPLLPRTKTLLPSAQYSTDLHVKAGGEVLAGKGDKAVGLRFPRMGWGGGVRAAAEDYDE
jgi:hypothetical protein